jgi:hypothetical protein
MNDIFTQAEIMISFHFLFPLDIGFLANNFVHLLSSKINKANSTTF